MGIEPIDPASKLTQDMRDALETGLIKAFNKEAKDNADQIDPPDLSDQVAEFQDQMWDEKEDSDKFDWAKYNWSEFPTDEGGSKEPTVIALPHRWDPLQEGHSDQDYRRTQAVGTQMSRERAADLMMKRGVFEDRSQALRAATRLDNSIWAAWKSASTSKEGSLLQSATAAELGGRARGEWRPTQDVINRANATYDLSGGWEGLKAYVRAKWETTQYMLDKADKPMLNVYRGISKEERGKEVSVRSPTEFSKEYIQLPDIEMERNGAQSTSTDASVSNGWGSPSTRVVMRIQAPRTAAISVPSYGQNIHSEHEVVLAGTAWKKWDAWHEKAPAFNAVEMHDQNRPLRDR